LSSASALPRFWEAARELGVARKTQYFDARNNADGLPSLDFSGMTEAERDVATEKVNAKVEVLSSDNGVTRLSLGVARNAGLGEVPRPFKAKQIDWDTVGEQEEESVH
jgi:hypothetical protein